MLALSGAITSSYADIGTFVPFCNKPPQRDIHRELDDIC
jgi:hypothetical protein